MHAQEVIDMHKAMLNFTASVHPGRLDYINELLGACYKVIQFVMNLKTFIFRN